MMISDLINITEKKSQDIEYPEFSKIIERDHNYYCLKDLISTIEISNNLNIDHRVIRSSIKNSISKQFGEFAVNCFEQRKNDSFYLELPAWMIYASRDEIKLVGDVAIDTGTLLKIIRSSNSSFYKELNDQDVFMYLDFVIGQMVNIECLVDTINA